MIQHREPVIGRRLFQVPGAILRWPPVGKSPGNHGQDRGWVRGPQVIRAYWRKPVMSPPSSTSHAAKPRRTDESRTPQSANGGYGSASAVMTRSR